MPQRSVTPPTAHRFPLVGGRAIGPSIDLSAQGLITANCINLAAGILLNDLGLPSYFFENITKDSLKQILSSITSSIAVQEDRVVLVGRVAHIDFDLEQGSQVQRVRIATRETRDAMEKLIETMISGHRREYYYSEENEYCTYIIRPETVSDFTKHEFKDSPFLFNLAGDYTATPEPTRMRYEKFLRDCKASVLPLVEAFNLPATGETRFMFNSDFATPQIPIFRKLLKDHGLTLMRAYWEPYWEDTDVTTSICSVAAPPWMRYLQCLGGLRKLLRAKRMALSMAFCTGTSQAERATAIMPVLIMMYACGSLTTNSSVST